VRVCARRVSLRLGRLGEAGLQYLLLDEMRPGAVIMLCEMTFICTYLILGSLVWIAEALVGIVMFRILSCLVNFLNLLSYIISSFIWL
jgi:hypothetical protein